MKGKCFRLVCLLLIVLVCTQAIPSGASDSSDSTRIARLAGICRLWGAIKYFHPDLATKDIEWDAALVKTIPKVNAAKSPEEYRAAVEYMLTLLGDPATRVAAGSRPAIKPAGSAGGKPQPYVRMTDDKIAVIVATDYSQFSGSSRTEELRKAFTDTA
jgi:hypothetical protein